MGFVLSILYILTHYLTPEVLFGPLATFRIELVLAILVTVVSIPFIAGSIVGRTIQSLAVGGLAVATFLSIVVGAHWFGGGLAAILLFIPNAFGYFLICLHFKSQKKLRVVVLIMLFVCLFVIGNGTYELHQGLPTKEQAQNVDLGETYFFGMDNDSGEWFYRLRGKGEISDPNDFAQLIACTLPLTFIFWRPKKFLRNFAFVLVPVSALLWGAYLTHSRGCILAVLAMVVVALRRKIGTVPSLVLAGGLFVAATALHVAGGRQISASAGEDRTALWGDGLQLLKTHPLFGVGFGDMPDYVTQTAHNTVVVCAAELGMVGLFFWSLFLLPSLRDAATIASPMKTSEELAPVTLPASLPSFAPAGVKDTRNRDADLLSKEEINRLGRLLVLAFTGFLVTGWFLSRAYVLTLFLLGGLTEVVFDMALTRGMISPRLPIGKVLRYSGLMTVGLVLMVYVMLRIVNLTH